MKTEPAICNQRAHKANATVPRDELATDGIVSKRRTSRQGRVSGGKAFARGALYRLLQNPIYRGEISHKGERHPGKHCPIIDAGLWDQVQAKLACNRVERRTGVRARQPSLLAGLVFDDRGERLIPTHANKKGTRYRYYVSQSLIKHSKAEAGDHGWRLPASDLEGVIEERLTTFLADDAEIDDAIEAHVDDLGERKRIIRQAAALAQRWAERDLSTRKAMLGVIVDRIEIRPGNITLKLRPQHLAEVVDPGFDPAVAPAPGDDRDIIPLVIPATLRRNGMAMTLTIDGRTPKRAPDRSLLRLLTLAERYRDSVLQAEGKSIKDLAAEAGVGSSYFTPGLSSRLSRPRPDQGHPPRTASTRPDRQTPRHRDKDQPKLGRAAKATRFFLTLIRQNTPSPSPNRDSDVRSSHGPRIHGVRGARDDVIITCTSQTAAVPRKRR